MEITCPQCGFSRNVAADKIPGEHVVVKCPKCACRFRFSPKNGVGEILPPKDWRNQDDPDAEEIRAMASNAYASEAKRFANEQKANATRQAWESQKASRLNPWASAPEPAGWLAAFYQTVLRVMLQAQNFFQTMRPEAGIMRPLGFFVIIAITQTLVERLWGRVIYSALGKSDDPQLEQLLSLLGPENSIITAVLFRVAALILQIYLFALLMYLAYRVVARDRASFTVVFQVLAYSAAPWLLCIIPIVGSLAGLIWGIGCLAVGCKTAMRLTWPQTLIGFAPLIAVLAPLLPEIMRLSGGS